jgi:hypothetical protein
MKKNNLIYFLLFILLVTGAFASMAQNSYGLKIMGGVAFAFGLIFLVELIGALTSEEKKDGFVLAELAAMIPFTIIFGCRVFNIYFPFIEWVFAAAGVVLVIFYIRKLLLRYRRLAVRNKSLAQLGVVFHLSIIFFLVTVILSPFAILWTKWIGLAGFVLLLAFITGSLIKKQYLLEGNNITPLQMVTGYRDHSVVLALLFLLISLYVTLNMAGLIPDIYSDEYPRAYTELVNKAASGEEKPMNGKYKHELFMEQYQLMLKHSKAKSR